MAALRVDLNNNPERDEYAVFTHEGAVRLKSLVPVDDVYPGLNANGQLGETTYLGESNDIIVTAAEADWVDNTEDGGGTWTTPEIEGVVYEPESGTAQPGESVTVEATAEQGYSIEGDTEWTTDYPVAPDPDPDPDRDPDPEPDRNAQPHATPTPDADAEAEPATQADAYAAAHVTVAT